MKVRSVVVKWIIILTVSVSCNTKRRDFRHVDETEKPFDTSGLAVSANLYYQTNMYLQAVNEYSMLIKYDSLNGRNYYRRGYSLVQLNRHEESLPDFLKAADLDYKHCDAYYSLALMYATILSNDSLALEYCGKCLEVDPNFKKVLNLVNQLNLKKTLL